MNSILSCLSRFDLFSVSFTPSISRSDKFEYKTIIGAIMSLAIMGISIIYTIYILYLWFSFQFLPVITQEVSIIDDKSQIHIDYISFKSYSNYVQDINPFQKNSTILNPILLLNSDNNNYTLLQEFINGEGFLSPNLTMNSQTVFYLTFSKCNQSLSDEYTCASEEQVQDFYQQQGNELWIEVNFSVINPSTFQQQTFQRDFTISLEQQQCIIQRLQFQPTLFQVSNSFLFVDFDSKYGFGDAISQTYVNSLDYYKQQYQRDGVVAAIYMAMDKKLTKQRFQYPLIAEVFAQIGSIISFLFIIQYLVQYINRKFMIEELLRQITQQYYAELQNLKISKSFMGGIQKVMLNEKQIDKDSYLKFIKSINQRFELKLSYINLLYEISRIQLMILQISNRDQILSSHQQFLRLPIKEYDDQLYLQGHEIDDSKIVPTINQCDNLQLNNLDSQVLQ
ncbi:hypothetical protein pb186bvf_014459 [Paramecium bursaria]